MTFSPPDPEITWLVPGDPFPSTDRAWGARTSAPGLLAVGGALDTTTLYQAYRQGIFPWYSHGQPPLWWSTDPRMVLPVQDFKLSGSQRKLIRSLLRQQRLEIRMDHAFSDVIQACAHTRRKGQHGTWILDDMVHAYQKFHDEGHVHSVETWLDGHLAGGLYVVNIGRMVYGESMFSHVSNASKTALSALVAFCRTHHMPLIDCQQQTAHLASVGGTPMSRSAFEQAMGDLTPLPSPTWQFHPTMWTNLLA
ncbi:MAG: leucyl/phenylalanyl-tRNA--protein transferase [Polaromonas sp.]|nr:leucyl/phenylalanyl-tRNA--protein transferase [Polaromonas sp.]